MNQIRFVYLLLVSFGIFNIGPVLDSTFRWTDHLRGFENGVQHIIVYGVWWGLFLLPWSFGIYTIYRWRRWKRFRAQWILAPAFLSLLLTIWALVFYPTSAPDRFRRFAKTELPEVVGNLCYRFTGGGFADYGDTYYFETSAEEVDRLVSELRLKEDDPALVDAGAYSLVTPLTDAPDFREWQGARHYRGWDEAQHWFYYLIVDSTRTKVYMMVGCI